MISPSMESVGNFLAERYSCRAYRREPVPTGSLERAVNRAQRAPSSKNTQPWKLALVRGESLKALSAKLLEAAGSGIKPRPDYQHSPTPLPGLHMERARKCGYDLFRLKGIARDDRAARQEHNLENHRFFGAPQAFVLYLEKPPEGDCTKGHYLDTGMFLMNLWHALRAEGCEACAQYSVAGYADIIREQLDLPGRTEIICSLAFGFPDTDALVNTYRTERAPLDEVMLRYD